jgi:hypothetical protein
MNITFVANSSRTGGCVGFEGYYECVCYFYGYVSETIYCSKSLCEAELIVLDNVASYVMYLLQKLDSMCEAFYSKEPAIVYQDNIGIMRSRVVYFW